MFLLAVAHIGTVSCILVFLSNSDPGGDVAC